MSFRITFVFIRHFVLYCLLTITNQLIPTFAYYLKAYCGVRRPFMYKAFAISFKITVATNYLDC